MARSRYPSLPLGQPALETMAAAAGEFEARLCNSGKQQCGATRATAVVAEAIHRSGFRDHRECSRPLAPPDARTSRIPLQRRMRWNTLGV
jgi:hypothetical protein